MFFKISVHRKFAVFTEKRLYWSPFLLKLQFVRPATLFKRDFNTGVFLWILLNFYERQLFSKKAFGGCIFQFDKVSFVLGICRSSLLNWKHVGWFLLRRYADQFRVCYSHIISKNHTSTFLLINMQQRLFVLIWDFGNVNRFLSYT